MQILNIGPWIITVSNDEHKYKIAIQEIDFITKDSVVNAVAAAIAKQRYGETYDINISMPLDTVPSLNHIHSLDREQFYKRFYEIVNGNVDTRRKIYMEIKENAESDTVNEEK